jgi:hypothetical protein
MPEKKQEIENSYGNTAFNNFGTQVFKSSCFQYLFLEINTTLEKNEKLNYFIIPLIGLLSFFIWIIYININFFNSGTILDSPLNIILYFLTLEFILLGWMSFYIIILKLFLKSR